MSSDLLDINADDHNVDIGIEVKSNGHAWITLVGDIEGEFCTYHLTPNNDGWTKAKCIIEALNEWISHTKTLEEMKNNENS